MAGSNGVPDDVTYELCGWKTRVRRELVLLLVIGGLPAGNVVVRPVLQPAQAAAEDQVQRVGQLQASIGVQAVLRFAQGRSTIPVRALRLRDGRMIRIEYIDRRIGRQVRRLLSGALA
ncbi:hypothetical protein G6F57_022319 [Rhizopus arrhizus]|nr:hypothetical protein G6F57_022319 [Rhizopus arrhizus]